MKAEHSVASPNCPYFVDMDAAVAQRDTYGAARVAWGYPQARDADKEAWWHARYDHRNDVSYWSGARLDQAQPSVPAMSAEEWRAMLERALRFGGGHLKLKRDCSCAPCARIALLREVARLRPDIGTMPEIIEDRGH